MSGFHAERRLVSAETGADAARAGNGVEEILEPEQRGATVPVWWGIDEPSASDTSARYSQRAAGADCWTDTSCSSAEEDAMPPSMSASPRIAARFSGASSSTRSSSRASLGRPSRAASARPSVTCRRQIERVPPKPVTQVAMASSKRPSRRYSSASAAKAIDAGSSWTRRSARRSAECHPSQHRPTWAKPPGPRSPSCPCRRSRCRTTL